MSPVVTWDCWQSARPWEEPQLSCWSCRCSTAGQMGTDHQDLHVQMDDYRYSSTWIYLWPLKASSKELRTRVLLYPDGSTALLSGQGQTFRSNYRNAWTIGTVETLLFTVIRVITVMPGRPTPPNLGKYNRKQQKHSKNHKYVMKGVFPVEHHTHALFSEPAFVPGCCDTISIYAHVCKTVLCVLRLFRRVDWWWPSRPLLQ